MTRRALLALSVLTFAACADPLSAPDVASDLGPTLKRNSGSGLPILTSARVSVNEAPGQPAHVRYDVDFRFVVPPTPRQAEVFAQAKARWEKIIIGDVPDVSGTLPAGACLPGLPTFSGTIDDMLIDVLLVPLDGPGGILGAAGWCAARDPGFLPAYGVMLFDTADLALLDQDGLFDEVIVHEMGHVLGIGTSWSFIDGLTSESGAGFLGRSANIHWRSAGGTGFLPIETDGGDGTAFAHWDEASLGNELMTGFIGGESPLSRITAASLRDMGYEVGIMAEPYRVPEPSGGDPTATAARSDLPGLRISTAERLIAPVALIAPE